VHTDLQGAANNGYGDHQVAIVDDDSWRLLENVKKEDTTSENVLGAGVEPHILDAIGVQKQDTSDEPKTNERSSEMSGKSNLGEYIVV
jgi:hypothetical protein